MTHKLPEFPSPLAGEDTKPWPRSGLGGVGEGDWLIGQASRWAITLRPVHFLSCKGAKAQKSASPASHPELVSGSYLSTAAKK